MLELSCDAPFGAPPAGALGLLGHGLTGAGLEARFDVLGYCSCYLYKCQLHMQERWSDRAAPPGTARQAHGDHTALERQDCEGRTPAARSCSRTASKSCQGSGPG